MHHKFKSIILVFVQIISSAFIFLSGPIRVNGVALKFLLILGFLLGLWAVWTIKLDNLNVSPGIKQNGRLVRHGPYKYIRHPMYSALLLVTLVLVLNDFSLMRFSVWGILLIDILFKLSYEEKLLTLHFKEYSDYKARTKLIIPFIF